MTVIKKRIMTLTTLPKEDEKNDLEASLLNDENRSQTKSDSENGENLDSVPVFEIEEKKVEKKIVSLSRLLRLANSEWKIGIVAMIALLISTVNSCMSNLYDYFEYTLGFNSVNLNYLGCNCEPTVFLWFDCYDEYRQY